MTQTYDSNNIFAKIIRREIPSKIVYEDEKIIAFHDAFPTAPTHILVIPKGEYRNFHEFSSKAGPEEISYFFKKIPEIASIVGAEDYRIVSNNGENSGQTIFHFHVHIISGRKISKLAD